MLNLRRVFFTSFVFFFLLVLPELVFSFISPEMQECGSFRQWGGIFLLAILLSFVENKKLLLWFVGVFAFLQILQFSFVGYLKTYLTPTLMENFFVELSGILIEIKQHFFSFCGIVCLVAFSYGFLAFLISQDVLNRVTFKQGSLLFVVFVVGFFYHSFSVLKNDSDTPFKTSCVASYNVINSVSGVVGKVLIQKTTTLHLIENVEKEEVQEVVFTEEVQEEPQEEQIDLEAL